MNEQDAAIERMALDWTMRVQRSDFADWDALTDWIDADPRHADSFNRLSLLEADVAGCVRQMPSLPQPSPGAAMAPAPVPAMAGRKTARPRHWGALAASVTLVAGLASGWLTLHRIRPSAPGAPLAINTRPGERRDIMLADGTRIAIAGGTQLSVDPAGREVALTQGRALFSVTHDAARPFSVRLGDVTVTDVGTLFDLRRGVDGVDVAVGQGEVRIDGEGAPLALRAGRMVRLRAGVQSSAEAIDPATVGAWRQGRFSYADATIAEVAADIGGATGAKVHVAPDVAGRRFAGSIRIDGDAGQTLRAVAPILGVSVTLQGGTWMLDARPDAGQS